MTVQVTPQPATDSVALLFAGAATAKNFTIMETIRAKFSKTSRDIHLATAMEQLIANAVQREDTSLPPSFDNRGRGSGLVLVGPTGVGKSKSLERYFSQHPVLSGYADPASGSPLVSVSVPSPCTSMQLARAAPAGDRLRARARYGSPSPVSSGVWPSCPSRASRLKSTTTSGRWSALT